MGLGKRDQLEKELMGQTRLGLLMVDYQYAPTRGDVASPATFPMLSMEKKTVEGWTFEASQRGAHGGNWPASEFRLVKADGSRDEYWRRVWDAIPSRSYYYQVEEKLEDGYFDEEDYKKGVVMRYPADVAMRKMVEAVHELEEKGVTAIAADSGFSMHFQEEVAAMTEVPVGLSSLIQLSWIVNVHGKKDMRERNQKVIVLTANARVFNEKVKCLLPYDVEEDLVHVVGLENTKFGQWIEKGATFMEFKWKPKRGLFSCCKKMPKEMASVEEAMEGIVAEVQGHMNELMKKGCCVVAIVSECSELPPHTNILR